MMLMSCSANKETSAAVWQPTPLYIRGSGVSLEGVGRGGTGRLNPDNVVNKIGTVVIMFPPLWGGGHTTVPTNHNIWRERRAEARFLELRSNWLTVSEHNGPIYTYTGEPTAAQSGGIELYV